jgi:hypothetical protein
MVVITYRYNPTYNPCVQMSRLIKEVDYFISDDKDNDTLHVQHCFMLLWEHMKQLGYFPFQHIVLSDGCSNQFKSSRAWFFVV